MAKQDPITRSLALVDKVLRETFPDDFDKRCMYAAFGLRRLLHETGLTPVIVGGQFMCLVISPDGKRATVQGFGSPNAPTQEPSHYWVEVGQTLVDLGPHYLPRRSSHPAAPIPFIRWPLQIGLPPFLRYQATVRYDPDVMLASDEAITARMNDFLTRCQQESQEAIGDAKIPGWQFRDMPSLQYAAQRGDVWARGAMFFIKTRPPMAFPF
ncbi:hypothetical protein [Bordetella bronchiseptica]|uniref:hypothetical protein n=1 Tax=Bordetella bronchiseptica TaxID=518 RepID=UPI001268DE1B|nr:hypothetical protein [Bordetella bronchiseptica]